MLTRRASLPALSVVLLLAASAAPGIAVFAQAGGAVPAVRDAGSQPTAAQPVEHAPAEAAHGSEHPIRDTLARLLNFGILAGVIVYFLKTPLGSYLTGRSAQIRQGLVTAAEMRRTATAQLEAIQQRLSALPAELIALKARGQEDMRAEEARIAQTAAAERERLLDQTRRELDTRLRLARRELTEYAAHLAVAVAEERIRRTITPDDQLRLVDRYTTQLREAP